MALKQGVELVPDTKGLSRLEFPLSPTWKASDVEKGRFHGFPFPQNLIGWMKTVQPGTADKPLDHPDCGLHNTLEDIHNLARHDRHRRLRVVSMLSLNQEVRLIGTEPPGGNIVDYEWLDSNPLDGKYDVARVKVVGLGDLLPYKIYLRPTLSFSVFAEDVEPYAGANMGVQLERFIAAVARVIARFDEEFV